MKDTRINFETAKLAKEKGFDIKTKYSWYVPDNSKPIIEKHKPDGLYYLSCPTQSLLAKWLREEHNIYVSPRESYGFDGTTLEIVCTVNGVFVNHNFKDKPINRFENFEEAYEIGLQEALKLI